MKLKHALIIGGVGMAIGGVMMAVSYMSGANLNVAWHDTQRWSILSILINFCRSGY